MGMERILDLFFLLYFSIYLVKLFEPHLVVQRVVYVI